MNLIQIFDETLEITRNDPSIAAKTAESIQNTVIHDPGFTSPTRQIKQDTCAIQVVAGSTFDTARALGEGKTAVLNFANPNTPGGGVVDGARAQEEALCRCSNLYDVLDTEALEEAFYLWHRLQRNRLFSDKVIYSPDIRIIRSDDLEKLDTYCSVDVLTCAAPYNIPPRKAEELRPVYQSRVKNILETAMAHDVDTIVLGAFGCGAFFNPPELMSETFRSVLIDEQYALYFKKVIFAIYCQSPSDRNFTVFKNTLLD